MSDATIVAAEAGTRQAMIRVWMAISAVWIVFWLSIAALFAVTGEMSGPFGDQFRLFALIVLVPPLTMLIVGVAFRFVFEALLRRNKTV
jgi:hypothetical protein